MVFIKYTNNRKIVELMPMMLFHVTYMYKYYYYFKSTIIYGQQFGVINCINSVQHKAIRFFMGVGRYTPHAQ